MPAIMEKWVELRVIRAGYQFSMPLCKLNSVAERLKISKQAAHKRIRQGGLKPIVQEVEMPANRPTRSYYLASEVDALAHELELLK